MKFAATKTVRNPYKTGHIQAVQCTTNTDGKYACHRPSTRPCHLDAGLAKPQASLCLTIMVDSHEQILIIIIQLILHA